jgi:Fic family protein
MAVRGRPGTDQVLQKLDQAVQVLHQRLGGLPDSPEADNIWKNIWLEETHHSTALEGNTLTSRELYYLVELGVARGNKELRHYLEAEGYATAAHWVYEEAVTAFKQRGFNFSMAHVRHAHILLIRPLWDVRHPVSGDRPGEFRHAPAIIAGSPVKPVPAGEVADRMEQWVARVTAGSQRAHPVAWAAELHADFEIIHPFADGNGRTGRLLMNYILIAHGYPPSIILKSQRSRYIGALEQAQLRNNYLGIVDLVARSVLENLNKLLLPYVATESDLVPLAVLGKESGYQASYLRGLAQTGKLRAVKAGNIWFSSQQWFDEYLESRSSKGRKLKNHFDSNN